MQKKDRQSNQLNHYKCPAVGGLDSIMFISYLQYAFEFMKLNTSIMTWIQYRTNVNWTVELQS